MFGSSPHHRRPARQAWRIGEIVSVGFVRGLVVKGRFATLHPGEAAPWALWQPATGRWYRFTPHAGIERLDGAPAAADFRLSPPDLDRAATGRAA
jgi:hypothetical protein